MKRILVEIIFSITITSIGIGAAYIHRGEFAMGGEWTLLFLPVIMEGLKCEQ